ncbi:MAG: hypothetical protein LBI13_03805 [Streptococcaceae bacterium]|jgi:hypothetical protein|nr:hypothetical protein [Streptococcaceae bacterium]
MYDYAYDNPYLNTELLNEQFIAAMKAQERNAIYAILDAQKAQISNVGTDLSQGLDNKASDMKDFASNRLLSRLKDGLEGRAADEANDYLTNRLKKSEFRSPIK